MLEINGKGYQPKTPSEIRELLIKECLDKIEGFETRPADLNNNLINEAAIACAYVENTLNYLYNSQSPSYANEIIFKQFASEQGLTQKGAYKSYVELKITGDPFVIIPKDTEITTETSDFIYKTESEAIISSTGECLVNAYCDNDGHALQPNTLNKFVNELKGLKSVKNITQPSPAVDVESFDKFKDRVQATWRSPRAGTYDYVISLVKNINGVIPRSVAFNTTERFEIIENEKRYYNSAELVVMGGDSNEIVKALYKGGGISSFIFKSYPSNNETERKIIKSLTLGNSIFTYEFTRPKILNIEIETNLSLIGLVADSEALQNLTKESYVSYFKDLQVGTQINKLTLQSLFFDGFKKSGSQWSQVNQIDFKILINNKEATFNQNDFLEIPFDCLIELKNYNVRIND